MPGAAQQGVSVLLASWRASCATAPVRLCACVLCGVLTGVPCCFCLYCVSQGAVAYIKAGGIFNSDRSNFSNNRADDDGGMGGVAYIAADGIFNSDRSTFINNTVVRDVCFCRRLILCGFWRACDCALVCCASC